MFAFALYFKKACDKVDRNLKATVELSKTLIFQTLIYYGRPLEVSELFEEISGIIQISSEVFNEALYYEQFFQFEKYIDLVIRKLSHEQNERALIDDFFSAGYPLSVGQLIKLLSVYKPNIVQEKERIGRLLSNDIKLFQLGPGLFGAKAWISVGDIDLMSPSIKKYAETENLDCIEDFMRVSGCILTFEEIVDISRENGLFARNEKLFRLLYNNPKFQYVGLGRWALDDDLDELWLAEGKQGTFDIADMEARSYDLLLIKDQDIESVYKIFYEYNAPIAIDRLVNGFFKPQNKEQYKAILLALNHVLGADGRFIMVSDTEWYLLELLPGSTFISPIFKSLRKDGINDISTLQQVSLVPNREGNRKSIETIGEGIKEGSRHIFYVSATDIDHGFLYAGERGPFLSYPLITVIYFKDDRGTDYTAWFNNSTRCLCGLEGWYQSRNVGVGDRIEIEKSDNGKRFRFYIQIGDKVQSRTQRVVKPQKRGILKAVTELLELNRFGLNVKKIIEELGTEFSDVTEEVLITYLEQYKFFIKVPSTGVWSLRDIEDARKRSRWVRGNFQNETDYMAARRLNFKNIRSALISYNAKLPWHVSSISGVIYTTALTAACPRINEITEKELFVRVLEGDKESGKILAMAYLEYVWNQTLKMLQRMSLMDGRDEWYDFEDAFQEGVIGLLQSIKSFDPNKGHRLSSYAYFHILTSITRWLTRNRYFVEIPSHFYEVAEKLDRSYNYARKCGNLEENIFCKRYANRHDMSYERVLEILNFIKIETVDIEEMEEVADFDCGISRIEDHDVLELVKNQLGKLTKQEYTVIYLRFGLGNGTPRTLEAIGPVLGVTRERIRQIEKKALEKLRNNKIIKQVYQDLLC